MERRSFLMSAGLLSLSGCLQLSGSSSTSTSTQSSTPTATATDSPTATATDSPTATATDSPTATATDSPTATATDSPTATATDSPTATATEIPDKDGDGVSNAEDDYPENPDYSNEIIGVNDSYTIEGDTWYYWTYEFDTDGVVAFSFDVVAGPSEIDVYTMSEREYQYFENEQDFRYFEDASVPNRSSGSARVELDQGKYRTVFDNTDRGAHGEILSEAAQVEIEIVVAE